MLDCDTLKAAYLALPNQNDVVEKLEAMLNWTPGRVQRAAEELNVRDEALLMFDSQSGCQKLVHFSFVADQ